MSLLLPSGARMLTFVVWDHGQSAHQSDSGTRSTAPCRAGAGVVGDAGELVIVEGWEERLPALWTAQGVSAVCLIPSWWAAGCRCAHRYVTAFRRGSGSPITVRRLPGIGTEMLRR
jgi:hypothetical protein